MSSISAEAKVGLFVLVALIILGYMSFRVGEYGFGLRKGYMVNVLFDSVSGLEKDASVQIAGVEVGRVEKISLKDGKALVAMRILPDIKLEKDVAVSIKTHGILGDKYIDIAPGTDGESYVTEGGNLSNVEKQADIDKLLTDLGSIAEDIKTVSSSLSDVAGGEEGRASLKAILDNTRELTENLNKIVKQNDDKFDAMMSTLDRTSREMERTFTALGDITERINEGKGTIGKLVNEEGVLDNLDRVLVSLNDITEKINSGKGTIGKLVNDEETVENLNAGLKSIDESMGSINKFISRSERFRTFLSYRGEYLFDSSDAKSYLDLKLQPREDKFYILGLVTDPRGRRTVTDYTDSTGQTTRTEKWERDELLFNLQIGKRYEDFVLRAGIFESTGGVGMDYFAFNDDLKLTFEAFDFDADRNAHLKAYAEYELLKHIYLSAGWDDFISDEGNESPFIGLSIKFEDEDLKYLLTNVPVPN